MLEQTIHLAGLLRIQPSPENETFLTPFSVTHTLSTREERLTHSAYYWLLFVILHDYLKD